MFKQDMPLKEVLTIITLVIIGFIIFGYLQIKKANDNDSSTPKPRAEVVDTIQLTGPGQAMKSLHADWSNKACNSVALKEVFIGMTTEQLVIAWGEPTTINTTETPNGINRQWVYSGGEYGKDRYAYSTNGIATSFQY